MAVVLYFALADVRSELGTVLILIGAWQVLFYVAWRGWPFSAIERRPLRLTCAHVVVIASGVLTYFLAHEVLGVGPEPLAAFAGCFVAAGLLFGMLFEGWLDRVATVVAALALAALLALTLHAIAEGLSFTRASADEWVTHVGLNAIGVSIIMHVGIGRRWPFETARDREGSAAAPARREGQPGVA